MSGNSPSDGVAVTDKKFAERLRRQANDGHGWDKAPGMMVEAADRIDKLRSKKEAWPSRAQKAYLIGVAVGAFIGFVVGLVTGLHR